MLKYCIGIDGGGTSCRAAVADADGHVLGIGKSGSSNILTSPDLAIANIEKAARAAFETAGLPSDLIAQTPVFLGLAGSNVEDTVAYVLPKLPFKKSIIESDGLIALQGALGDGAGAAAIIGTGTIYLARANDTVHSIGGWGFTLSDLGSGARVGRLALETSLLAYDNIVEPSDLTTSILEEFHNSAPKVVAFGQTAKPGDFGRFAPRVFDCARAGDINARRILEQSAAQIDASLDRLSTITNGGRLCLLGGLSTVYPPYLAERHCQRLVTPQSDALQGAVSLALKAFLREAT